MSGVVKQPSRELRRLAVRIGAGIDRYASVRGNAALSSEWEASRHAWTLSNLAMRHAEVTAHLARTDVVFAPSAWATARAAVEAAAQFVWLLEPEDKWEREARWLALLYEGARFGSRREVAELRAARDRSDLVTKFADEVVLKLPQGYVVPPMPGVQKIIASQSRELGAFYVTSSQFAHATEIATSTYRIGLGGEAAYGEHTGEASWFQPLWQSWEAFRVTAWTLIVREGGTPLPTGLALVDRQLDEARDEFLGSIYPGGDSRLRDAGQKDDVNHDREKET